MNNIASPEFYFYYLALEQRIQTFYPVTHTFKVLLIYRTRVPRLWSLFGSRDAVLVFLRS